MKKLFTFIFIFTLFFGSINISRAALSVSLLDPICSNLNCAFSANVVQQNGVYAPDYIWDFGDGEVYKTPNSTVSHTYNSAGEYTIVVSAIDNDSAGFIAKDTKTITIPKTIIGNENNQQNSSTSINDTLSNLPLGNEKLAGKDNPNIDTIIEIFLDIVNWIFVVATGIGVLMIIISGISYMLAMGNSEGSGKATKMLLYSAIGVAVALASTFIIQIIKNFLISL